MNETDYKKIGNEIIKQKVDFLLFENVLTRAEEELDTTDPKTIVSFGYDFLDESLTGLFAGEMVVIGGESGTGKTTFATNIVYKASVHHKCAVFALEDRLHDYGIKALYFEMGRLRKKDGLKNYPWNAFRRNEITDENYKAYRTMAKESLKNENLFFGEAEKQMTIEILEKAITEQIAKGVTVFLIDHLHYFDLLRGDSSKADYVEQVMVRIKTIANKTGAKIILVVHYKKLEGKKPTLGSFKDSISIVQNANYVINLWRDRSLDEGEEVMGERYETKLFVPKSRNPNGECTFTLNFDPDTNDYKQQSVSYGTPQKDQENELKQIANDF